MGNGLSVHHNQTLTPTGIKPSKHKAQTQTRLADPLTQLRSLFTGGGLGLGCKGWGLMKNAKRNYSISSEVAVSNGPGCNRFSRDIDPTYGSLRFLLMLHITLFVSFTFICTNRQFQSSFSLSALLWLHYHFYSATSDKPFSQKQLITYCHQPGHTQ